jgi:hypothetical protein
MLSNFPQLELEVLPAAPPAAAQLYPPAPVDASSLPETNHPTAADLLALLHATAPLSLAPPAPAPADLPPCSAGAPAPPSSADAPASLDLATAEKEAPLLHARGLPSLFNIPVPDFPPSSPTEAPPLTRSPSPEHIRALLA